jgi:hypothetical protein
MSAFTITASNIGMIAGLIILAAYIPYIQGILAGKTRPNRASWFIWAVLGIIIAASYRLSGGIDSGWVPIGNVAGTIVIALLSIKHGQGGFTRLDLGCLLGAAAGLIAWSITNIPATALLIASAVDLLGYLPTIRKAYYEPWSEDRRAWTIFLFGYAINIFAISEWSLAIASYPVYQLALCALMVWLLVFRKRKG